MTQWNVFETLYMRYCVYELLFYLLVFLCSVRSIYVRILQTAVYEKWKKQAGVSYLSSII